MPPQGLLIIRFIFAIITAFFIFRGRYFEAVLFLSIYQFVFLFDYVDGKLARITGKFSPKWRRVDRTFHYLTSTLFLVTLTISYYNRFGDSLSLIFGLIGGFSILATFLVDSIWLKNIKFEKLVEIHREKNFFSGFYSFLTIDGSLTLFFFFVVFKLDYIAILLFSIEYFLILIRKLINLVKWKKIR